MGGAADRYVIARGDPTIRGRALQVPDSVPSHMVYPKMIRPPLAGRADHQRLLAQLRRAMPG